ncbi:MAG TPA: amidohydrolase family protein [Gemmatimonadales bacterium]|jgi:imidazolonepropionase-like amidohydrolase|nr:amidohydrolase family protein [Gemmatimonadales bacterium]
MRAPRFPHLTLVGLAAIGSGAAAQRADSMGRAVKDVLATDAPVIALTHVKLIDGTGRPARDDQTVVIEKGRITAVGRAGEVKPPAGATIIELSGHTLIPGLVGMHDHLYYTAAGGRSAQLTFTAPRLYLGAGVTTVRTTGSRAPYAEINLRSEIEKGRVPGPRIHVTAPYITGGEGMTTMTLLETPEQATRFVAYWAKEGATWLKAYTDIRKAELKAAIDEAHRQGIKVTGHLCSVSFTEAVGLGIDGLEHGLFTNSDYVPDKQPDLCPTGLVAAGSAVKPTDPAAQRTFKTMIDGKVPMTSTLAVYELFVPNRPTRDPRALEAMAPEVREDYLRARQQIDSSGQSRFTLEVFRNGMAYERAFVAAGGLLAAGVDPTGNGGALPGYGDQRNFELLREAEFTPEQVVQIMSFNGARILGVDKDLGTVEKGKLADLVVVRGDLTADPAAIKQVVTVFKDGIGYDSAKLFALVKGRVGIN